MGFLVSRLYATYRQSAKTRKITFELTKEQFHALIEQSCYICGSDPAKSTRKHGPDRVPFGGVDRIDNTLGYIEGNVRPCCKLCNVAKHELTIPEFIEHVKKMYRGIT